MRDNVNCLENGEWVYRFWETPRKKFLWFHFYRRPTALGTSLDELFDKDMQENEYTGKPFGEYHVTWGEWKRRVRKLCPIQYWLREDAKYLYKIPYWRISQRWYEFKCLFHPYNVIKIKTLPATWSDERTLLVHGIFAILGRFIDQKPEEHHDYEWKEWDKNACSTAEEWEKIAEPHRRFWKDVNRAWDWWQLRDQREKEIDVAYDLARPRRKKNLPYAEHYKELIEVEARHKAEEEEMLQLILKHRESLWA